MKKTLGIYGDVVIQNDFESWLKSSVGKFVEIYTNGHSLEKMRCLLVVLHILLRTNCYKLYSGIGKREFYGYWSGDRNRIRNGKYSDNCHRKSGLYKLLLLISTLFSLLSLWIMMLLCGSRKHIAEFYYFWNQHIESGRKLLKENLQLILVNKMLVSCCSIAL